MVVYKTNSDNFKFIVDYKNSVNFSLPNIYTSIEDNNNNNNIF